MGIVFKAACGLIAPHEGPHDYESVRCLSPDRCRQILVVARPTAMPPADMFALGDLPHVSMHPSKNSSQ